MSPRIRVGLIVTVTLVWSANFIAPIFRPEYVPPPETHVVFMAVLGGLSLGVTSRRDDE